jgi:F-type H+-transporting ATPase subunit epsilon
VPDGIFGLEVVTPEQSIIAGGVKSVVFESSDGGLTVLDGHTSLIGDVVPCDLKIEQPDGAMVHLAVHGGFFQVDTSAGAAEGLAEGDGPYAGMSTRLTVLAGVAELANEIDVARAEASKEAATQRVAELGSGRATDDAEAESGLVEAEQALARAELRLQVAAAD